MNKYYYSFRLYLSDIERMISFISSTTEEGVNKVACFAYCKTQQMMNSLTALQLKMYPSSHSFISTSSPNHSQTAFFTKLSLPLIFIVATMTSPENA